MSAQEPYVLEALGDYLGDNRDNWHYTFGIEENSGWLGHNGMIPGYMTYVVYNPALDSSIVLVQNSDKNAGQEPGINPLLRGISEVLRPQHPVNVPVVRRVQTMTCAPSKWTQHWVLPRALQGSAVFAAGVG